MAPQQMDGSIKWWSCASVHAPCETEDSLLEPIPYQAPWGRNDWGNIRKEKIEVTASSKPREVYNAEEEW